MADGREAFVPQRTIGPNNFKSIWFYELTIFSQASPYLFIHFSLLYLSSDFEREK